MGCADKELLRGGVRGPQAAAGGAGEQAEGPGAERGAEIEKVAESAESGVAVEAQHTERAKGGEQRPAAPHPQPAALPLGVGVPPDTAHYEHCAGKMTVYIQ